MYQEITILGYMGGDPELRYLPNGNPVANFNVATNEWSKDQDGNYSENTTWWRVTAYEKLAERVTEKCHKGSLLFIKGKLKSDTGGNPRVWETKSGEHRANFEVTANYMRFLDGKDASQDDDEGMPF